LVLAVIGFGLLACCGCGRDSPEDLAYRAQAAWKAKQPAETAAALTRLARLRPLTVSERLLLSRTASDRGQYKEALAALEGSGLPTKGPDAALIAVRRGELELERHRFRVAEAELTRALVLDPHCVDARHRLIWLYAQQGRSAELSAQARRLASSEPLDFTELLLWTLARHEPLEADHLAEVMAQAVREDPGDRASRLALAEYLRRLGRLDEADSALNVLDQTDPETRAARARVALDRGDVRGAEALLGAARDGEDQDHSALARLRGRLALGRSDAPAALRHFRAALKSGPNDRDTEFGLAQALRLAGQPEAAHPHGERARAWDRLEWLVQRARPENRRHDPATLRAIAQTCLALGRRDEACGWYRLALRLAPDDSEARNVLSQLDATLGQVPSSD
jgi:tetratricopeptide (TPR) repeat protein